MTSAAENPSWLRLGAAARVAREAAAARAARAVPLGGATGAVQELSADGPPWARIAWDAATLACIPAWYRRLAEHHGRDWKSARVRADRLEPFSAGADPAAAPFASERMERLRRRAERTSQLFDLPSEAPWPPRTCGSLLRAAQALQAKFDFPFAAEAALVEGVRFVLVYDLFPTSADRARALADPHSPLSAEAGLVADARDEHRPTAVPLADLIAPRGEAGRWVKAYRLWLRPG